MAHRAFGSVARQQQLSQNLCKGAFGRFHSSAYRSSTGRHNGLRCFSTSDAKFTSRSSSTIDFAYMPQHELEGSSQGDIVRVPILPHNSTASRYTGEATESVIKPEITTVSASGTHIDSPSAMSEVTDNHAIDFSPYDLTHKVTSAAAAAASEITGMSTERLKNPGVVQELWSGILDDILGGKKMARA